MATIPSNGTQLRFNDCNDFQPWYTAQEMMQLGVYGGNFFSRLAVRRKIPLSFFDAIPGIKWHSNAYLVGQNYFNQPEPLLITGAIDLNILARELHPYGWFQWYTELCAGKNSTWVNDYRITQWKADIKALFWYIENGNYVGTGNRYTDLTFLPNMRQGLLSRGWDPTKKPADYGII